MITLNAEQLTRLETIVKDNVVNYVIFNNGKFYGAHCSSTSDTICNLSKIVNRSKFDATVDLDNLMFVKLETQERIMFEIGR